MQATYVYEGVLVPGAAPEAHVDRFFHNLFRLPGLNFEEEGPWKLLLRTFMTDRMQSVDGLDDDNVSVMVADLQQRIRSFAASAALPENHNRLAHLGGRRIDPSWVDRPVELLKDHRIVLWGLREVMRSHEEPWSYAWLTRRRDQDTMYMGRRRVLLWLHQFWRIDLHGEKALLTERAKSSFSRVFNSFVGPHV